MKFICPSCGREEQLVGDPRPRCRVCPVEMIAESAYSDKLWMSPIFAIDRMRKVSEKYGIQKARGANKFKREREAWTTAMLALALGKLTGTEWWIEIETRASTPDTRLHRIDQKQGGNFIDNYDVEIVDWEENVDDIMEVIRKKCALAYPSNYLLLVNARNSGKLLDFDFVIEQMKRIKSPFSEVWVIAFIKTSEVKVVRVAPALPYVDLTQADFENGRKQRMFMTKGIRGTETQFKDLGLVYMPIPTLE